MSVISHLELNLLTAINNDLVNVLKFHSKVGGGFHSIPREVFCYIDYLGSLRYGPPSQSKKAISFLEEYLRKINNRYVEVGRLIYELWRHGTVHEFDPKSLIHSCKRYKVGWQTNIKNRAAERNCHLECFKKYGTKNSYLINVNLFQLSDDLISSINIFVAELKSNRQLNREVQSHFKQISKSSWLKKIGPREYSKKLLNDQILSAVKGQHREVKNGQVLS